MDFHLSFLDCCNAVCKLRKCYPITVFYKLILTFLYATRLLQSFEHTFSTSRTLFYFFETRCRTGLFVIQINTENHSINLFFSDFSKENKLLFYTPEGNNIELVDLTDEPTSYRIELPINIKSLHPLSQDQYLVRIYFTYLPSQIVSYMFLIFFHKGHLFQSSEVQ